MEVAGVALGAVPLITTITRYYANIIKGTAAASMQWQPFHTRLLTERARFESIIQQLSRVNTEDDFDSELKGVLNSLMLTTTESLLQVWGGDRIIPSIYVAPREEYIEDIIQQIIIIIIMGHTACSREAMAGKEVN